MNLNEKSFEKKFPGKRLQILKFLAKELKLLKKLGFPGYDIANIAQAYTKHVINILEE